MLKMKIVSVMCYGLKVGMKIFFLKYKNKIKKCLFILDKSPSHISEGILKIMEHIKYLIPAV